VLSEDSLSLAPSTRREALALTTSGLIGVALGSTAALAQNDQIATSPRTSDFLLKAQAAKPQLTATKQRPLGLINPVADATQQLGWRIEPAGNVDELERRVLKKGDHVIIDFGGHRTGYISFDLVGVGKNVDAPARLRLIFGEVVSDVAEPLHPYKGSLSEAWLPEEILTIDYLPQRVSLPRRYAFRFVKVEVIATSWTFGVALRNVEAKAVTSARGALPPLPRAVPDDLNQIDVVAAATLRDCMQTVFEDGPRRDQRLWTGDLRLQALTSYVSLRNDSLVKRCLYLLAAFPRSDGLLPGDVFELPRPSAAADFPHDYSILFAATLADYLDATGDLATANDLWPTAVRQFEVLSSMFDAKGVVSIPKGVWVFIDWHSKLDRTAAMQGVYIFGLKRLADMARKLGKLHEVGWLPQRVAQLERAAISAFHDPGLGLFVSGKDKQVSLASQAWMTLAGVGNRKMQARALRAALADPAAIKPSTPYLNHYVVEALFQAGCNREAVALIRSYWGGMLEAGANTFWEAYSPETPRVAPYGDFHVNSFCHAWSCTPSYLFRRYGDQLL